MSTFAIVVLVLAVVGIGTFIAMKTGKVKDANNNNIPDAIEEKVEEVVVKAKQVKAKAEKVVAVAEKAVKTVKTPKAPTTKKTTKK